MIDKRFSYWCADGCQDAIFTFKKSESRSQLLHIESWLNTNERKENKSNGVKKKFSTNSNLVELQKSPDKPLQSVNFLIIRCWIKAQFHTFTERFCSFKFLLVNWSQWNCLIPYLLSFFKAWLARRAKMAFQGKRAL